MPKALLSRPTDHQNSNNGKNIFSNCSQEPENENNNNIYDYVGSQELRKRIISSKSVVGETKKEVESLPGSIAVDSLQNTLVSKMNSTLKRTSFLSKLTREQHNEVTKQAKSLALYKEYKKVWEIQDIQLRRRTSKEKSLLSRNVKPLYIHPNPEKEQLLNEYVTKYWQMSLRNNDKKIKRHMSGAPYNEVEREKLLQLSKGFKVVEQSIPLLPLGELRNVKRGQLVLSGRSKLESEAKTTIVSARDSIPLTERGSRWGGEQVYRISYAGEKKFLGTQNL